MVERFLLQMEQIATETARKAAETRQLHQLQMLSELKEVIRLVRVQIVLSTPLLGDLCQIVADYCGWSRQALQHEDQIQYLCPRGWGPASVLFRNDCHVWVRFGDDDGVERNRVIDLLTDLNMAPAKQNMHVVGFCNPAEQKNTKENRAAARRALKQSLPA